MKSVLTNLLKENIIDFVWFALNFGCFVVVVYIAIEFKSLCVHVFH
jgi:hypothetical protein